MMRTYELSDRTSCVKCKSRIHGESGGGRQKWQRAVEYTAWSAMQARTKPENRNHEIYFDRGIRVCDEWIGEGGYKRFLAHVGRRPGKGYSLGRIDNDKGYEPGNVRWETWTQQQRNRSTCVNLTIDGVTRCVAEWSEISGVKAGTIRSRLRGKDGWAPREAVFTPTS